MRKKILLPLFVLFLVASCSNPSATSGGSSIDSQSSQDNQDSQSETSTTDTGENLLKDVDGATAKVKATAYKTYLNSSEYIEPLSYKTLISIKIRDKTSSSITNDLIRVNHNDQKFEVKSYLGLMSDDLLPYAAQYIFKNDKNKFVVANANAETKTYKVLENATYDEALGSTVQGMLVPKGAIKANNLKYIEKFLQTDFTREDVIEKSLKVKGEKEMLYSYTVKGGALTKGASSKTKYVFHIVDYRLEKVMSKVTELDENNNVIEETLTQQQYVYETQNITPPTLDDSWMKELSL